MSPAIGCRLRGVECLVSDRLSSDVRDEEGLRVEMSARAVAELALAGLSRASSPADALPLYVEGDSPWRQLDPG